MLFKHLRVHQIFGANTNVGKTVLTTALARSSSELNRVFYLKPISTGPAEEADDSHVRFYAGKFKGRIQDHCLYQFADPVSPHLAAKAVAKSKVPTDNQVLRAIEDHLKQCATSTMNERAHMYVETAGGVHSPMLSGISQADGYRPLFFPTILVGDSKLGGISSTISAFESLSLRGYIIDAILVFRDAHYRNYEYLTEYFAERGIHVSSFDPPPAIKEDHADNIRTTREYYDSLTESRPNELSDLQNHLNRRHEDRLKELESMPRRSSDVFWWPFVQHGLVKEQEVNVIDSAYSDYFSTVRQPSAPGASIPRASVLGKQFDGSASWWTQALGHAHPSLTLAAARASGRYGHVMFPKATHLPALRLAERLVKSGPGKDWASRAFFSDDGSTGMEVALKMALRAYSQKHGITAQDQKSLGVLGLKGSYHGDTIGAMDACEEGVYTCEWHNAKGYWLEPPTISISNGQAIVTVPASIGGEAQTVSSSSLNDLYDVTSRLNSSLAETYRTHIESTLHKLPQHRIAALVLEPLVMGAGGMIFVDPLFQRILVDTVRGTYHDTTSWSGLPVIFDEVFVGLYRIGQESCRHILGVNPDIAVYAKILTGGLLPLAVTLASDSIFKSFLSDKKEEALLHGHSYTAHAVGCEVANETLNQIDRMVARGEWDGAVKRWSDHAGGSSQVWSFWEPGFLETVSHQEIVDEVMALGTVLAVKLKDADAGYLSHSAEAIFKPLLTPTGDDFPIHYRTLGNVAYFMTSLNTPQSTVQHIQKRILAILQT